MPKSSLILGVEQVVSVTRWWLLWAVSPILPYSHPHGCYLDFL